MTVEKAVDLVMDTIAIIVCLGLFYWAMTLIPGAFDQMFAWMDGAPR